MDPFKNSKLLTEESNLIDVTPLSPWNSTSSLKVDTPVTKRLRNSKSNIFAFPNTSSKFSGCVLPIPTLPGFNLLSATKTVPPTPTANRSLSSKSVNDNSSGKLTLSKNVVSPDIVSFGAPEINGVVNFVSVNS